MKNSVQKLSDEYLLEAQKMSKEDILQFLDDFRVIVGKAEKQESQLISIKVPKQLLRSFRVKAELNKMPYQTMIKLLMEKWLENEP